MKCEWEEVSGRIVLGSVLICTLGIALDSTDCLANQELNTSSSVHQFTHGVVDRAKASSKIQISETADAALIREKAWKWNRYLKNALNIQEWIDLGLKHRTRFEVYDHSWRSSQPFGRTDYQIEQRSRVRIGLNGRMFKFVFEGQDSRSYLNNPGDFVNNTIVNEMDSVQLLVSARAKNVFGTGLRADLHFGRLTMDFGRRWLIARNGMRNTTNAFDGVHGQLAQGKDWCVRALVVEPVLRAEVQLDEQSKRNVFWGVYGETYQVPWLRLNTYYFGLNDQQNPVVSRQRTLECTSMKNPKTAGWTTALKVSGRRGKGEISITLHIFNISTSGIPLIRHGPHAS